MPISFQSPVYVGIVIHGDYINFSTWYLALIPRRSQPIGCNVVYKHIYGKHHGMCSSWRGEITFQYITWSYCRHIPLSSASNTSQDNFIHTTTLRGDISTVRPASRVCGFDFNQFMETRHYTLRTTSCMVINFTTLLIENI